MSKKQECKYHIINKSGNIVGSFVHEYDRDHFLFLYNEKKSHKHDERMSKKDE